MSILNQKTIKKPISFNGVGLHTGAKVNLKIIPAEPNAGILFKRIDIDKNNIIIPNVFNVTNTTLCTTISNEFGIKVSTIEHLMGALYGIGIDNALIELDSQEVPILDGSGINFIEEILKSGISSSQVPIKLIKIEKEVEYKTEGKFIKIKPSRVNLDIDFEIKYKNQLIGNQRNKINVFNDDLIEIYQELPQW